tara:strand:- start:43505 stop:44584 length:1080 start_codon:yes stop_codon:yes gene_type:complete
MISLSQINNVGYGFGYGYQNNKISNYNIKHFKSLEYAVKLKCNFIDTAREYGNGSSEQQIGLLKNADKTKIFISTKVSPENLTYEKFINSVTKSLDALNVDCIDLIQPHWPSEKFNINEIIKAFLYLKEKKFVRYFGLSNFPLSTAIYVKKKIPKYFKFIQDRYLPGDPFSEKKLKFCKKNKLFYVVYSPFHFFDLKKKEILKNIYKLGFKKQSYHKVLLNFQLSKYKNIIVIPRSFKKENIKNNSDLNFKKKDKLNYETLSKELAFEFKSLNLDKIKIFQNKFFIQNLKEARNIRSEKNLSLTPLQISRNLNNNNKHKILPIIVERIGPDLYLKEGQVRYWAFFIKFGKKSTINCIII